MAKSNCPYSESDCRCASGRYPHLCKNLVTKAFHVTRSEFAQLAEHARSRGFFGTGPFKSDPQAARLITMIVREWLENHQQ